MNYYETRIADDHGTQWENIGNLIDRDGPDRTDRPDGRDRTRTTDRPNRTTDDRRKTNGQTAAGPTDGRRRPTQDRRRKNTADQNRGLPRMAKVLLGDKIGWGKTREVRALVNAARGQGNAPQF